MSFIHRRDTSSHRRRVTVLGLVFRIVCKALRVLLLIAGAMGPSAPPPPPPPPQTIEARAESEASENED